MASIRRTLSLYNDRLYQTGGNMFSAQSPSHKIMHNGKGQSPLSNFGVGVHRLIAGEKYSRKGGHYMWRRSSCRILLFFLLGFILGLAPFGEFKDVKRHDFSFELKPPSINVQENLEDLALTRGLDNKKHDFSFEIKPPSINVQEKLEDLAFTKGLDNENVLVDKAKLAVEKENTMLILKERFDFVPRKQVIVVTPTYNRALQAFYLNRLGQLLRLVPPPLLWIVVEMNAASTETAGILGDIGVMHRHLVCSKNLTNIKDRGVHQRNTALEHIENHKLNGIVYFADDDNMYSLKLFESIREISRFGTWPVAMLAQSKNKAVLEGPVCNGSQVVGWHTNDKSKKLRRFHVDMSGFAFNSTILWDTKSWHRPTSDSIRQLDTVKEGFQETTFIEQIVEDESQMEATPLGCSNIMNWHLHLEANELVYPRGWRLQKNLDVIHPIK